MATSADNSVANFFFHSPWRPKWSQLGALAAGIWKRAIIWISRRPIDVSIDGVDIPLFLNSVDIFAESLLQL